jgi:hypothetical protein
MKNNAVKGHQSRRLNKMKEIIVIETTGTQGGLPLHPRRQP